MKIETIFEFIRFSLNDQMREFESVEDVDWEELFNFAQKQTIIGVLFAGVEKMPEGKRPPKSVLMKWFMMVERIKATNEKLNKAAIEVTSRFQKDGFRGCVLKGQGIACLYPNPFVRTAGDIDIWIDSDKDEIAAYVNRICPGQKQRMIHIDFPILQGISVEVHFTPSYMYAPWSNRKMQEWFKEQAKEQFDHQISLPNGAGQVCVPTLSFNRIFILSHIYKHLFSEGIGLRQLMDYFYVLKQGFTETENLYDRKVLSSLGMQKFAGAVIYVLKTVFGLEDKFCIVEPNEKAGQFLLSEIMQSGNFGHYDERYGATENETVAHRYFRITRRNLHFVTSYPSEALSEPIRRTWFFFKKKLKK